MPRPKQAILFDKIPEKKMHYLFFSVDFTKFPGMAEVEYYYHVNMTAGDCLYIPYKW